MQPLTAGCLLRARSAMHAAARDTLFKRYHKGRRNAGARGSHIVWMSAPKWEYCVGVRDGMRSLPVKCALALLGVSISSILLSAQSTNRQPEQSTVFRNSAAPQGANWETGPSASFGVARMEGFGQQPMYAFVARCPVFMHAGHLADGSLVKTGPTHPTGIGQWLSLSLSSPGKMPIARATLVVRGLTPKGHVAQALRASGGSGDAVRTFHVSFSPGPSRTSIANLWVPGMSVVERIDLLELGYGDGSTWRVTDGQSCHVAPDPFMRITQR